LTAPYLQQNVFELCEKCKARASATAGGTVSSRRNIQKELVERTEIPKPSQLGEMTRRTCREHQRLEKNGEAVLNFKDSSLLAKNYSQKPDLSNGMMTCQYGYRIMNVGDDLWRSVIQPPAQSRVNLD